MYNPNIYTDLESLRETNMDLETLELLAEFLQQFLPIQLVEYKLCNQVFSQLFRGIIRMIMVRRFSSTKSSSSATKIRTTRYHNVMEATLA